MLFETIYAKMLFLFITSAFLCVLITPAVKLFSIWADILKKPEHRSVHSKPMPLLGGLGIAIASFASVVLLYAMKIDEFNLADYVNLIPVITGGMIILIIGIIDDIKGMKAATKFLAQIAAALLLWISGIRLYFFIPYTGPDTPLIVYVLCLFTTLFWLLAFTNAMNLIDGLDGLATGISAIVFLSLGVISVFNNDHVQAYICFAIGGATIAFLKYNFNPAKIFLGDTGSLFLGFMLGGISLTGSIKNATVGTIMIPVVLMGLPVLDTGLTIVRRVLKNINIFQADRDHIHHKLLDMGFSHRKVVVILYCVSLVFAVSAVYLSFNNGKNVGFIVLIFSGMAYVALNKLGYTEYLEFLKFRNRNGMEGNMPFEIKYFNLISKINLAKTPEVLWSYTAKIIELIGFERSSMHLLEYKREKLSTLFTWSMRPDLIKDLMKKYEKMTRDQNIGCGGSIASFVLSMQEPDIIVVRDKEEVRGKICDNILDNIAADEFVCIPLLGSTGMLGALIADKYFTKSRIEEDEIALLVSLSSLISVIIEKNGLLNNERMKIFLPSEKRKPMERKDGFEKLH